MTHNSERQHDLTHRMSDMDGLPGDSAEPVYSRESSAMNIKENVQIRLPDPSFTAEQTSLTTIAVRSAAPHVARPPPSACTSQEKSLPSPVGVPCHPLSTHGDSGNRRSPCALSSGNDHCLLLSGTEHVNQAAMTRQPTVPVAGKGEGAWTDVPAATRLYHNPTPLTMQPEDLSAAMNALANGASGVTIDVRTDSPPSSLSVGAGATELSGATSGTQGVVSGLPLGSTVQQRMPQHHDNACAFPCPHQLAQEEFTAALTPTEDDAGYTIGSASRKWEVDAPATKNGDAASSPHGAAEVDRDSPKSSTWMYVEKHGLDRKEVYPKEYLLASPPLTISSPPTGNSDGDGDRNNNTVNGTSRTVDQSVSGHASATRGCDRGALASPQQMSDAPMNCIPSAARGAPERATTPTRGESNSTGGVAVNDLRELPARLEHNESLKGNADPFASSTSTTLSAANIAAEGGAASCLSMATTRSAQAIMPSGAVWSLLPTPNPSSGLCVQPTRTPSTPTMAPNNCKVARGERSEEGPAETIETKTQDGSQVQSNNDHSVPAQCTSEALPLLRLQRTSPTRRYSLEDLTDPSGKDNSAGGALVTGAEPRTAHLKLVADDDPSLRSNNSSLPPSLANSRVEECEVNSPRVNAAETAQNDAQANGSTVLGAEEAGFAGGSSSKEGEGSSLSPSFSVQREAHVDVTTPTSAADPASAGAGTPPRPDNVSTNSDLPGTNSTSVKCKETLQKSSVTDLASALHSVPSSTQQQPQTQQLPTDSVCGSPCTVALGDGVTPASRSQHRDAWQTYFDLDNGNGLSNSPQVSGTSPSVDFSVALAKQRAREVVVGGSGAEEDDGLWRNSTSSKLRDDVQPPPKSIADTPARHVTFADPATACLVEPPASPWAESEYFCSPDFSYMEYKDDEEGSPSEQHRHHLADSLLVDKEEDEILRGIPPFRFLRRNVRMKSASQLSSAVAQPSAPAWEAWTRRSDGLQSRTSAEERSDNAHADSRVVWAHQQPKAAALTPQQGGSVQEDADHAAAEKVPRVFFTKERLASRAALMQSRRAGFQAAVSTNGDSSAGAPCLIPAPGASSASLLRPPPPATVPSAPVASTPASTWHDSKMSQTQSLPPPKDNISTLKGADEDDGFGEWVQPQHHAASAPPLPAAAVSPIASQSLTKVQCIQLLAGFDERNDFVPRSTASLAVDTESVIGILRDVFCDTVAAPTSLRNESISPGTPLEPLSANSTSPNDFSASGGSLSTVEHVLGALGFTPLKGLANRACPIRNCAITSLATCGPHSAWQPPLPGAGSALLTGVSAPTVGKGPIQAIDNSAAGTSAEMATSLGPHLEDGEEANVRLARQRLFPVSAQLFSSRSRDSVTSSVASFLGSRRLPDAASTVAKWTETDVFLTVLQEELRMAQENGGVVAKERLEDVLKAACS